MNKARALLTVCCALAAWLTSYPLVAQDTRIIEFAEAIRIALERNTTVRQAQNDAALGTLNVTDARNQFLPDLRANAQGGQSYGRIFSQSEGRVINDTTDSLSVGVSSGVTLFNGFANTASLRQAKLDSQASGLDLHRTNETVVFTVVTNFLVLIGQQEQLRVRRETLVAEVALEQQIQSFVDAGARTIADLYQQQANVASARLAVVEAERSAQLAEVDLMQTLQLDPRGTYEFKPPAMDSIYRSADTADLDALMERALAQRADLAGLRTRVESAQQGIRVARSGHWPTLSLGAGYDTGYTSASDSNLSDQLDERRGGSVGLNVSIPIFDRGATRTATRRAEIQADNATLAFEGLENEVGLQVRRAHLDVHAAQERLSAAQAQQRAAELALQASQDRYQAGAATLVELSQARADQVTAASELVSARYNAMFQRALMGYYVGDLSAERLLP